MNAMKHRTLLARHRWLRDGAILALASYALYVGVKQILAYTARPPEHPVDYVKVNDWQKYAKAGHSIGPEDATVTIVEFIDYTCQVCKEAEAELEVLRSQYSTDLLMVYRYLPTAGHRSLEVFRLVECAAQIGRFKEVHRAVLAHADTLSSWDWKEWLSDIADADARAAYTVCMDVAPQHVAVRRDAIVARELGLRGTPSFLINDMLVAGYPGLTALDEVVRIALGHR